jgi:hypothetical protein
MFICLTIANVITITIVIIKSKKIGNIILNLEYYIPYNSNNKYKYLIFILLSTQLINNIHYKTIKILCFTHQC